MGMKGKMIVSLEVKCGGHLVYDIFHTNTHHLPYISPSRIKHFEIHEGEIGKIDSILRLSHRSSKEINYLESDWRKSLELYNSFTAITSCEHWTTITLVCEKKLKILQNPLLSWIISLV
ncbi:hypothetical protein H5410_064559 [Solanum commersonii]|uniref:Uncharacterized protein n=1 Tax=Solanum commersonii TaxID=4109 RepID=A0A9J5VYZ8_SOLCO|nr:hypothetical protein H5410_064559 [Solanum commersonii]